MAQMGRPGLSATRKLELWRRSKEGKSLTGIANARGKQAASIHGTVAMRYRAAHADDAARKRARRPKLCRLAQHPRPCSMLARRLALDWSPEQSAAWFRLDYARQSDMRDWARRSSWTTPSSKSSGLRSP